MAIKLYFKLSISRKNIKLQPVILFDTSIGREISFRSSLNRVKMFIELSDEYSSFPIFRLRNKVHINFHGSAQRIFSFIQYSQSVGN